jgi:hypothetical protein
MDDVEILCSSIRHMALNGISRFYVYDHCRDLDLYETLRERFNTDAVEIRVIQKRTPRFYQRQMVGVLASLARMDGFEVAVAFDADEFWCAQTPDLTLAQQIERELDPALDALCVQVVNYLQSSTVKQFSQPSLAQARFTTRTIPQEGRQPWDLMDAGIPFAALPFPAKVIPRLAADVGFTEGQHGAHSSVRELRIKPSDRIIVRHLPLCSKAHLECKREHGLRRIASGFSSEIGWQAQRWSRFSNEELEIEWMRNSWKQGEEQRTHTKGFDDLVEDDGLARIEQLLQQHAARFWNDSSPAHTPMNPVQRISPEQLEQVVQELIDDSGAAALHFERLEQEHMVILQRMQEEHDLAISAAMATVKLNSLPIGPLRRLELSVRRLRKRLLGV